MQKAYNNHLVDYGYNFSNANEIYLFHWKGIENFGFYHTKPEGHSGEYCIAIFKIKTRH